MGFNVVQKLIAAHLIEGDPTPGSAVTVRVTQAMAHDVTGPRVLEHYERLGVERVKCDLVVFYVDHELTPRTAEAVERSAALRAGARRVGAHFSRPGNGLGHLVHLERFAVPGRTLVGAGAHSQILGAAGMLALSGEAVEVAAVMAGEPLELVVPEVLRVTLLGKPRPFVSPKDVALELLRRRGAGGLAGKAIEVDGPGARALGVYERATIAAAGPALGAVTTVFPSDEKTKIFLQRQRRSKSWRRIEADVDAVYHGEEVIELGALEPLAVAEGAEVRPVRELAGRPVHEVLVGSCANGSARDVLTVAALLRGKKVHPDCTFAVAPGTRQALEVLAREGSGDGGRALADLVSAGVRILESGCGPCAAAHALPAGSISIRTFSHPSCRPEGAEVLVVSPETAAACAVHGQVVDPRKLKRPPRVKLPRQLPVDDSMILRPRPERSRKGRPARPSQTPAAAKAAQLEEAIRAEVVRRLGHGARLEPVEADEPLRAEGRGRGKAVARCLVAGRDLAYDAQEQEVASGHRRSGIRVIVAESFAPPCEVSLANAGVVPLRFLDPGSYERVKPGDELVIRGLARNVRSGEPIRIAVAGNGTEFRVACDLGERGREILVAGGLLAYLTRSQRASSPPPR